ncbi:MAG: MarC family protein [Chitinophagaceae bacterium]
MDFKLNHFFAISVSLFAIIDIVGAIPFLLSLQKKSGKINAYLATFFSGGLMILFLFIGEPFLALFGLTASVFALAGAIVIFLLGLEMVLGHTIFKDDHIHAGGSVFPIAFPLVAGAGTLTTILSLRANYSILEILGGIFVNLIIVFIVLKLLYQINKFVGYNGLNAMRKFFGVILIAIALNLFIKNYSKLKLTTTNVTPLQTQKIDISNLANT